MVDDYILVGSANFTPDSLNWHGEVAVLFKLDESQSPNSAPQVLKLSLEESIRQAEEGAIQDD